MAESAGTESSAKDPLTTGTFSVRLSDFGYEPTPKDDEPAAEGSEADLDQEATLSNAYATAWATVHVEHVLGGENQTLFNPPTSEYASLTESKNAFVFEHTSEEFPIDASSVTSVANQSIVIKIFTGEVAPGDPAADTLLSTVHLQLIDALKSGYFDGQVAVPGAEGPAGEAYSLAIQVSVTSPVQQFCSFGRFLLIQNGQLTLTPQDPSNDEITSAIKKSKFAISMKSLAPSAQPDEVEFVEIWNGELVQEGKEASESAVGGDSAAETADAEESKATEDVASPQTDFIFTWPRQRVVFLDSYAVDVLSLHNDALEHVTLKLSSHDGSDGSDSLSEPLSCNVHLGSLASDNKAMCEAEFPLHDALWEADLKFNAPLVQQATEPAAASIAVTEVAPSITARDYEVKPTSDPNEYLKDQLQLVVDKVLNHCNKAAADAGTGSAESSTKAMRQAVYDALNTTGEYYKFKETLKSAMIRFAKTYSKQQSDSAGKRVDITSDAFATDLYTEIMRRTNIIINKHAAAGRIPVQHELQEPTPSPAELAVLAYEAQQEGNRPLARSLYDQLTKTEPLNFGPWLRFAKFSLSEHAFAKASECLRQCVGLDPSNSEALLLYGAYLISDSAFDHAEAVLLHGVRNVADLKPRQPGSGGGMGDVAAALLAVSESARGESEDDNAGSGDAAPSKRSVFRDWRVIQREPVRAAEALASAAELCALHGLHGPADHAIGLAAEVEAAATGDEQTASFPPGTFDDTSARRRVVRGELYLARVRDANPSPRDIQDDEAAADARAEEARKAKEEAEAQAAEAAAAAAESGEVAKPEEGTDETADQDQEHAGDDGREAAPLSAGELLRKAEENFSAALELNEELPRALDGLGWALLLRGKALEAANMWEQSVRLREEIAEAGEDVDDTPVRIYMSLARVYHATGDYLAAKEVWLRCCKEPYTATATSWLGVALASDRIPGSLDETRLALIQANRLDKTNAQVWGQLALNCFRRAQQDKSPTSANRTLELAQTSLSYALKFGLRDADTLYELGLCYQRSENYELAEELFRRSLFQQESSETRIHFAQIMLAQNRHADALHQYRAALSRSSADESLDPGTARRIGQRINELVSILGQ